MDDKRILRSGFSYDPAQVPVKNMSVIHSPKKNGPDEQTEGTEQLETSLIEFVNGSHSGETTRKGQQNSHINDDSKNMRNAEATTSRTATQVSPEVMYQYLPPMMPRTDSVTYRSYSEF